MNALLLAAALVFVSDDGDPQAEERRQQTAAVDVLRAPEKAGEVARPPEPALRRAVYEETGKKKERDQ